MESCKDYSFLPQEGGEEQQQQEEEQQLLRGIDLRFRCR